MANRADPPYATRSVVVDGITIVVPQDLPGPARCAELHALYVEHVKPTQPGGHWKGACQAEVDAAVAADVREAMDFHGSIVDSELALPGGRVRLFSEGYWAHGF
jgi:hypothetical protein